ncbi:MAG: class A beta-lactamase-related serine hydrolase [Saprospiraceae bacterium]|nr:class A beta-lactamase-related serine hydrolase [Saprospiraceae bacterium]
MMKARVWTIILPIMLFDQCQPANNLTQLEQVVEKMFSSEEGTFAMAFKDLQTGEELLINADELFHAASTMKTPVMIEVYRQAAEGKFDLDDSLTVRNQFYSIVDSSTYSLSASEDSEKSLYDQIGKKKSIADLLYEMIIVSSNLATNIIIDHVDARKVTETMNRIGAGDMLVLRGVEDIKAYENGLSNRTSAHALMIIFNQLATGRVVDERASEAMIKILKDQRFRDIIPAQLPDEIVVAHKTGAITGVHHDSGVIYLPDGRKYVLVLLSKDLEDFEAGTSLLASVSKTIFDYMQGS